MAKKNTTTTTGKTTGSKPAPPPPPKPAPAKSPQTGNGGSTSTKGKTQTTNPSPAKSPQTGGGSKGTKGKTQTTNPAPATTAPVKGKTGFTPSPQNAGTTTAKNVQGGEGKGAGTKSSSSKSDFTPIKSVLKSDWKSQPTPIDVQPRLDEMNNPMLRDIKRRFKEQPDIMKGALRSSKSPEDAFNKLFAEWGRDPEMDSAALASLQGTSILSHSENSYDNAEIDEKIIRAIHNQLKGFAFEENEPESFQEFIQNLGYTFQSMGAQVYIQLASAWATSTVPTLPDDRLEATRVFYGAYGHNLGFSDDANTPYGYGQSHLDFLEWEVGRGVLNPIDSDVPGSEWWRAVNAQLMRDMEEARLIHVAGLDEYGGTNPAVNTWLNYLNDPSPQTWYAAHDASIVLGYAENVNLAYEESLSEQILMTTVLNRLLLAETMVTASANDLLYLLGDNTGSVGDNLENLFVTLANPTGNAVDLITGIETIYPSNYPLTPQDIQAVVNQYALEAVSINVLEYADVNSTSVSRMITSIGFANTGDFYFQIAEDLVNGVHRPELDASDPENVNPIRYYQLALEQYMLALEYPDLVSSGTAYLEQRITQIQSRIGE
jgi:hypothetical protein